MEKKKELKDSKLKSYFQESLFLDGIFHPDGSNIAPKSYWRQDLKTGYKYNTSGYGILNYEIMEVDYEKDSLKVKGEFLNMEYKDYSYYWNQATEKSKFLDQKLSFQMKDNGTFSSKLFFKENVLMMNTQVSIIRNTFGYNYDGKSIRNGMFPCFSYDDGRREFEYEEYYQLLSSGERLLHYSMHSVFFEVYDLPKGWKFEDGIMGIRPKVFDDTTYDEMDKDLLEMRGIVICAGEKCKQEHGMVRVKTKLD